MRNYKQQLLPWKDRSSSLTRGFVAGSMIGWWLDIVVYLALAAFTTVALSPVLVVMFFAGAALSTYMWFHG